MDGQPFRVRTFEIIIEDTIENEKKTLVLVHGFMTPSVMFYKMLNLLAH